MLFEELPYDLIHRIYSFLPKYLIYRLLRSKICAKVAYDIYYKEISIERIERDFSDSFPPSITSNYMPQPQPWGNYEQCGFALFPDAKSIVNFYKTHPLFEPHTLWYDSLDQLESIHKECPTLLQKFKTFNKRPGESWVGVSLDWKFPCSFDYQSLVHDQYPLEGLDVRPRSIKILDCYYDAEDVMPTVETVILRNIERFHDFNRDLFPNLRDLSVTCQMQGRIYPNLPNLKEFTMESNGNSIDLSLCVNLEELNLTGIGNEGIGLDIDNHIVLPPNLKSLSIKSILVATQWEDFDKLESLKCLNLQFSMLNLESDSPYAMDTFKLPPKLYELAIEFKRRGNDGARFIWPDCEIPDTLRIVRATGFDMSKFPKNKRLDVYENDHDIEGGPQNTGLQYLKCSTSDDRFDGKFPSSLQSLDIHEGYGVGSFSALKRLTTLKQTMSEARWLPTVTLPPSINDIFWVSLKADNVVNYENLVRLTLIGCDVNINFRKVTNLQNFRLVSNRGEYFSLHNLPDSIRTLILESSHVWGSDFPKDLQYLHIDDCVFPDGPIKLNKSLKVLVLEYFKHDIGATLKHAGPFLEAIHIDSCHPPEFEADLTHTSLEYFTMVTDHLDREKYNVKLPKSLNTYRLSVGGLSQTRYKPL